MRVAPQLSREAVFDAGTIQLNDGDSRTAIAVDAPAGGEPFGVVLLDALYGHLEKFASWIGKNRSAFFISAYTRHLKRRDDDLAQMLRAKGIPVQTELDGPLKAGTVAFLSTEDARHRDYVTSAWTANPVKDVLVRIARR